MPGVPHPRPTHPDPLHSRERGLERGSIDGVDILVHLAQLFRDDYGVNCCVDRIRGDWRASRYCPGKRVNGTGGVAVCPKDDPDRLESAFGQIANDLTGFCSNRIRNPRNQKGSYFDG